MTTMTLRIERETLLQLPADSLLTIGRAVGLDELPEVWKASKDTLVATIEEHLKPHPKGLGVGRLVREMILEEPERSPTEIAAAVRESIPEARTTARSVSSVKCALRKQGLLQTVDDEEVEAEGEATSA